MDRCVAQNMDIFRIGTLNHKTQAHLKADLYTYLQKEKQSLHMRGDHVMTVSFCLQRSRSGKSQETNVGTQM